MKTDKSEIDLWPSGLPANARLLPDEQIEQLKKQQTEEHLTWVEKPTLTLYPASPETTNGCCVVVCPGGGYNILAWPKEGLELAEWFNSFGVSAVVLKCRVPRRHLKYPHREPMQDGQRALRLVRYNAAEWNIDPERIGLLGFSAGAHLSLMVATQHQSDSYVRIDTADDVSARPDFVCPIYVAYLGPNYSDDRPELGSLVKISQNTPPTFMAVTLDDSYRGVQTGLLLNQFKQAGVSAESHIYAVGGHGYGIRPSDNPISSWHHRLQDWMRLSGLFQSPNES